ncbi:hypothetical protein [Viridibacterium curvum]|uniref:PNPLA domain-containing protein n=1 Tax=Viridibacterium curvum TaxID=1101404 RepID=A0ABP9R7N0_9RHOO
MGAVGRSETNRLDSRVVDPVVGGEGGGDAGRIAFALGGLGGGNAFGAGFLAAARERNIRPHAITCTSGMIVWTAHFLAGDDLRDKLRQHIAEMPKAPESLPFGNQMMLAKGLPGVFRPATQEYWERWSFLSPFSSLSPLSDTKEWADRLLPAQTWVPTRTPEYFAFIANTLADSDVAILFNAFCPPSGQEVLFLNDAACGMLGVNYFDQTPETLYMPISAEGVEAALHLYSYGYERKYFDMHLIDGAYHRQFILNELIDLTAPVRAETIWVVRPQNSRWMGEMPSNYFEQRHMETEIGMNSSYSMQVARVDRINRALREGKLSDPAIRPIRLEPFQFTGKREFSDYFIESEEVFNSAYHRALDQLVARHGWQPRPFPMVAAEG